MIKQKQLVPKRRFNDFKESWKLIQLEEILNVNSGRDYKHLNKGNIPVYGTGGLMLYVDDMLSEVDGIGVGRKGTIDKPQYLKAPFWTVDTLFYMTPNQKTDLYFIYAKSQMINWRKMDESTGVPSLSKVTIEKIPFYWPEYKEQQKIGQFFKHFDEMIALQQRKLDKTKALKSAYLAEMFPAEGERVPKRRFEGFVDEWKIRKIEEVAPLRNGKGFESNNFKNNGVPIIRISNILSTGNIGGKYIYYDEEDNDADYTIPNGAALIAMSGATTGKVSVMKINNYEKVYQNQRVGMFKDLGKANYKYLITLLQSELFESQLMSVLVAGAQPNISSQEINNFEFFFPDNINEQEMVGNFFKNIDNLIATHQQKLDKLKATKQAYLHEMFV